MKHTRSFKTLAEWRKWMGITQREAALLLGVSQPGYGKFELGQRRPRPERAIIISRKTGVPFENLLGVA